MSVRPPRPDLPPKPQARKDSVSFWQYLALCLGVIFFWRSLCGFMGRGWLSFAHRFFDRIY